MNHVSAPDLSSNGFPGPAEPEAFETLIGGLIDSGVGICDRIFGEQLLDGLQAKLEHFHKTGEMHPAGVGRKFDYVKNAGIRGDVIRWIDPSTEDMLEKAFLAVIGRFIDYMNASCYTGINDLEFHYAWYDAGSFYKRHIDRFRSDKGREFSFVLYLNQDWKAADGGSLSLYLENGEQQVLPCKGRVVFFRSGETEHEVHPSVGRPRMSIAGWLKRV